MELRIERRKGKWARQRIELATLATPRRAESDGRVPAATAKQVAAVRAPFSALTRSNAAFASELVPEFTSRTDMLRPRTASSTMAKSPHLEAKSASTALDSASGSGS